MPRGQYDRSAIRKVKPEVEPLVFVNPDRDRINRVLAPKVDADPNATDVDRALVGLPPREVHPEIADIARLLVEPAPQPPIVPTRESFDAWLDADAPVMPANDRVSQMVGEWASLFCAGWHSATWLPINDGQDIAVTLTTEHGSSEMAEPAGQWREADIAEALAAMRVKLRV